MLIQVSILFTIIIQSNNINIVNDFSLQILVIYVTSSYVRAL